MSGGQRLALAATWMASAMTVTLMTLSEHFRIVLIDVALQVDSGTMAVMAVLGEIVLVCVTVVVATVVAQLAFGQAVDELRQQIALRRLVGSKRAAERRGLFGRFAATGAIGAVAGYGTGAALSALATQALRSALPEWSAAPLPSLQPGAIIPAVGVAIGALLAAWGASRNVLGVAPLEALADAQVDSRFARPARLTGGLVTVSVGVALLAAGVALGFFTPQAVLVGVVGGAVTVFGIVALATPATSAMLKLFKWPLQGSAVGRSAYGSLVRAPHRVGGITIALTVGIAAVTMFAVAGETAQSVLLGMVDHVDIRADQEAALNEMTAQLMTVVSLAVACGSGVAVFGFIATMLMSVRARTREIGLMRLVGMRVKQARSMIVVETAVIAALAMIGGLALGILFGWLGTFMMLGSVAGIGVMLPQLPWSLVPALLVATALVATATAVPAARRASGIPPLAAVNAA
ncbi:ABC transporter permease [uncultured Agrococcus sp.]|uniref:ABC transporter permease n=1 Tax=uncultured Agrococcus sp. TaxID=382258 RepID=UPI0025FDF47D|nr:ABC transporter permease [uncultured Agrococcus sp.]